ncbi:vWA domain-containing protein [Shimia thalassica]|uniref:vWA domain-containing protein n=1 Tax=Shimia thalassica TaxID=1715693 RepID=UPI0026E2DF6A|nr:VWA domain-containing protein [Shimia thalassica]MDO6484011.1 VWA domain-containing protein [Shimia thalassica]
MAAFQNPSEGRVMQTLLDILAVFHFLRPLWLLALPLIVWVWYRVRKPRNAGAATSEKIAPHLAEALTVGSTGTKRLQPIDGVVLSMILMTLAAAGPTWSRVENPFLSQTASMAVALEVSRSMEAPDLPPNRLDRAKFKVLDLIERRAGARTALFAYAGSAHRVAPLTEDPNILRAMLDGLSPKVMPSDGNNVTAALELARAELSKTETPGTILLVLDSIDRADLAALQPTEGGDPVVVLFAAPETEPLGALVEMASSSVIRLTADDSDLNKIERAAESAYRAALLGDDRLDWEDRGWVFAWPAALILLLWFRQGWTMRWALALLLLGNLFAPNTARADVVDWFLTADQQGMVAYNNKEYADAAELFLDPMWRALALFKSGQYPEAADVYSRMDTAEAAFGEGMAHTRNREYRPAIAAYTKALELQPDFPEAQHNLEVTTYVLEYVESAREASDTGEDSGIGADDVVYDNEADRGADTQTDFLQEEKPVFKSTEQWMRSVDTEMGDFLRSRFLLEASGGNQ